MHQGNVELVTTAVTIQLLTTLDIAYLQYIDKSTRPYDHKS